jgi:hypothetical protein
MQTFTLYTDENGFVLTNGHVTNALRIATLEDLLRLRQRINQYIDTQQADGPLPEVNQIAQAEMIDTLGAIKLAEALGYGVIPQQTLRSACDAGNIEGAHKRSRSGRAQTKRGGRWEFSPEAFIEWLQDRRGAPPVDFDPAQSSLQGNFSFA